ncbi:hypothetical protein D9619_012989 [Psilocybe cf. subviscida]|uniref:Cytochrome c oxidase assembly protein COX16, mitochondrial n=1 Tax=Psilocybe cf. subviscida TaxID=2480587 RepID=A0A8H5F5B7_9AGAR|nr:hypothetical protein D9619_012989 [Psilocybe cf. subviscida]
MSVFGPNPYKNHSTVNTMIRKHPSLFGIPFILLMVGASFGLTTFTQTRYDHHDQKVKVMSKEQELNLKKDRKKFDIREEYFRLSAEADENWENIRIARPKGIPEWGVPPTEPPSKDSSK